MSALKITQKKIVSVLVVVSAIFACVVFFRIMAILLPPFIFSVKPNKESLENTMVIRGMRLGKIDHSTRIIINGKKTPTHDIFQWSNSKIVLHYGRTESDIGSLVLYVNEKKSNVKSFVLLRNNHPETTDQNYPQLDKIASRPSLASPPKVHPYEPIVFDTQDNDERGKWTYRYNGVTHTIPTYQWQYNETPTQNIFYLSERFWFDYRNSITFSYMHTTPPSIYRIALAPLNKKMQDANTYNMRLTYEPEFRSHALMLPIQSMYQHTLLLDKTNPNDFALDFDQSYMLSFQPTNTLNVRITNKIDTSNNSEHEIQPVLYHDEQIFHHLFDALSSEDLAHIHTFIREKIQDNSTFTQLTAPPILKTQTTKTLLALSKNLEKDNTDSSGIQENAMQEIISQINTYIYSVYDFTSQITLEEIRALPLTLSITPLTQENELELIQNIIGSSLLRTQGIIARTVIGIHITSYMDEQDKELLRVTSSSWMEILTTEQGWLSREQNAYTASSRNRISLYTFERYLQLSHNNTQPLVPSHIDILSVLY